MTYPRWLLVAFTATHWPATPILGIAVLDGSITVSLAPAFSTFTALAPGDGCCLTKSPLEPTLLMTTTCSLCGSPVGGGVGAGVDGVGVDGVGAGVEGVGAGCGVGVGVDGVDGVVGAGVALCCTSQPATYPWCPFGSCTWIHCPFWPIFASAPVLGSMTFNGTPGISA
jgi:hypothetical protein